jgi:hypothetical protein
MDVVVTVPKSFTHPDAPGKRGLAAWIAEGDPAGSKWSGTRWSFTVAGPKPEIGPGERVYIVCEGRLRGYAPLVTVRCAGDPKQRGFNRWELIRGGDAVAVTIPDRIKGFQGWRYRWWDRKDEIPFPEWQTP